MNSGLNHQVISRVPIFYAFLASLLFFPASIVCLCPVFPLGWLASIDCTLSLNFLSCFPRVVFQASCDLVKNLQCTTCSTLSSALSCCHLALGRLKTGVCLETFYLSIWFFAHLETSWSLHVLLELFRAERISLLGKHHQGLGGSRRN